MVRKRESLNRAISYLLCKNTKHLLIKAHFKHNIGELDVNWPPEADIFMEVGRLDKSPSCNYPLLDLSEKSFDSAKRATFGSGLGAM
ncbi:MAG: hypothetical protein ABSB83_02945 [Methanomassiliicoccales archaeon]|jgi:hypothetical protein